MGLFSWFRRDDESDFEHVFERLDASIQKREGHLTDIKARERRAVVMFTSWSLGLWAAYVAVWWTGALSRSPDVTAWQRATLAAPLAIGPLITVFTRRLFRWWYRRKQNREDGELKVLRKKQQDQVEKLKKLTRYDETRTLLEKYDEKTRRSSFMTFPIRGGSPSRSLATTPRGSPTARGRGGPILAPPLNAHFATPTRGAFVNSPVTGSPASRGWVDRFADKILGDDENANRYALICAKCFAHNGLVLKAELATTQYTCPKCGHFNPPKAASVVGIDDPSSLPRSRTFSAHAALSPLSGGPGSGSGVFGRHTHRHSMVELANNAPHPSLRPPLLPKRPSSAGDAEGPSPRMVEEDDEDDEDRAASDSEVQPPSKRQHRELSTGGRTSHGEDSDEMDEG